VQREKGISYLPGIEGKIQKSLAASSKYEKTYSGQDYSLYSLKKTRDTDTSTLIDMQWQNTLDYFNHKGDTDDTMFFPLQMAKFTQGDARKRVMTDSVERSFYDLYVSKGADRTFVPNPISLPFNSEYVASSNFTNNTLSLSTLYAKDDDYNYLHENVPSLINLQRPSFVGLTKGEVALNVKIKAPQSGSYRLLLHAASKGKEVQASISGTEVKLTKIKDDQAAKGDFIDFTYFYQDVKLEQGTHILDLKNIDQNAVIIDSATLIPASDIPSTFDRVTFANLQITPTDKELIYDVRMEQSK
jgi:hypothetical protein